MQIKLALALAVVLASWTVLADETKFTGAKPVLGSAESAKTGPELLDPEQAFKPQIRIVDRWTAEIRFDIVPGYYLYRDRIRVDAEFTRQPVAARKQSANGTPTVDANAVKHPLRLTLPAGRRVDDPTFGKVDIFDKRTTLVVNLSTEIAEVASDGKSVNAKGGKKAGSHSPASKFILTSQGCAAAGVCFPSQQHEFPMSAQVSTGKGASTSEAGWLSPLSAARSLGFGKSTSPVSSLSPPK